jgi:hypothetical protein
MHRLSRYHNGIIVLEEGLNKFTSKPDLQNIFMNLKRAKHLHDATKTCHKAAIKSLRCNAEIALERHKHEMRELQQDSNAILDERDAETLLEIQKLRFYLKAMEANACMMDDMAAQKVDVRNVCHADWDGADAPSSSVTKSKI